MKKESTFEFDKTRKAWKVSGETTKMPEPLGLPMTTFLYQSMHDVPGHPIKVNVVQTIQPPSPPQAAGIWTSIGYRCIHDTGIRAFR